MAKANANRKPSRSKKAGVPPAASVSPPRVRRRQKTATVAFRKDTTIHQAAEGPRVVWAAGKPRLRKGHGS